MDTLMQAREGDAIIIPGRTLRGRPDEILAELDEIISGMLALRSMLAPGQRVVPQASTGRRALRILAGPFARLGHVVTPTAPGARHA
jgi:hypothetical protein